MTIEVMLEQSGVLTLLGMGVVFGFLIIMESPSVWREK
jgi:Na+-transporting methylmalonyl-CoA/oxaloacetate decarboxylase gamma subunit